jgi:hypothetical protein
MWQPYQLHNVDVVQGPMYLDLSTYLVAVQRSQPLLMVHLHPQGTGMRFCTGC